MENILEQYEEFMQTSKFYPQDKLPITYPALGLNGEAGEVAEKVKKCWRDNDGVFDDNIKRAILKELADTLWYIWACADDMGYTLKDVLEIGIKKVKERKETNTVHGSGDDRENIDKKLMQKILTLPKTTQIKRYILSLIIHDSHETHFNDIPLRKEQKVIIKFFDNSHNDSIYEGIYKGISRMDGGLLIDFGEETNLNEITAKINKIGENYLFYVNGIQYNNITYNIIDYVQNK